MPHLSTRFRKRLWYFRVILAWVLHILGILAGATIFVLFAYSQFAQSAMWDAEFTFPERSLLGFEVGLGVGLVWLIFHSFGRLITWTGLFDDMPRLNESWRWQS